MTSCASKKRPKRNIESRAEESKYSSARPPARKKQTTTDTTLANILSGRDIERAIVLSVNFQREREFMYGIMDEIFRALPAEEDDKTSEDDEDIDVEHYKNNNNAEEKITSAKEIHQRLCEMFYSADDLYKRCD